MAAIVLPATQQSRLECSIVNNRTSTSRKFCEQRAKTVFDIAPFTVATLKVLRVLADTVLTGSFNFIYVKLGVPLPP